jgi:hypothetical protein
MDPLGYGCTVTYLRFFYASLCMLTLLKSRKVVTISCKREYFAYIGSLPREG